MRNRAAGLRADRPAGASSATGLDRFRSVSPAAIVFAALVVATVGAFFVTTRLKRSAPVLEQLTFNRHFSPNHDGRLDFAVFAFRLRRTDDVTVSIVTRDGDQIRTLAEDLRLSKRRRHRFRWDGRTDTGLIAPDGEYHIRVGLRRQGRTVTSPRKLFLDTTPPRPVVRYVSPDVITPDAGGRRSRATLRFVGPTRKPTLLVYRTDLPKPRLVARRTGRTGSGTLKWDGRTGLDRAAGLAPAGSYLLAVQARDAAGNIGPAKLPPTRKTVRGHPGVDVRYLAAGPVGAAVQAGAIAKFTVLAAGRRYRWRIHRRGSSRSLSKGSSRSATLRFRVPRSLAGLALLQLRRGAHRYTVPFTVQPRRHRRVLVVLPTLTWQALNPVEQNGDGFPDVLPLDPAVGLRRPLAGDGMPRGFGEAAALLGYLDAAHLRYGVRTDEDLLRAGAAALRRYSGVLMAAPERFAPASLTACSGRSRPPEAGSPGPESAASPGAWRSRARSCPGDAPRAQRERSASGSGSLAAAARSWCSVTGSTSSGAWGESSARTPRSSRPCGCRRGRGCSPPPEQSPTGRRSWSTAPAAASLPASVSPASPGRLRCRRMPGG